MKNFKTVSLKIRWHDLFKKEMSASVRRKRWDQWLALAKPEMADFWKDFSGCEDCIHLNGYWCKFQELPCTVNPYLTMRHGMIGMACQGIGKETIGQMELCI